MGASTTLLREKKMNAIDTTSLRLEERVLFIGFSEVMLMFAVS